MSAIFPLLMFVIFIGCVAFLYTEGTWGNAIRLINVVTAGLLATNFWEPAARALEGMNDTFTYYWDFLVLWVLFAVFSIIFRVATNTLSRVKVKFLKIADTAGSVFFAVWVGWVMVCFTAFTMHTAPLARNFLWGGFDPQARMLMGLAPDRQWLGFTMRMSRGPFCRSASDEELQQGRYGHEANPTDPDEKLCVFDRSAEFLPKYATRRANLEKNAADNNASRVTSGSTPKR